MPDRSDQQLFALPLNLPASGVWGLLLIWSLESQRLLEISVLAKTPTSAYLSPFDQPGVVKETAQLLQAFFADQQYDISSWLNTHLSELAGTPFQVAVWREIANIPVGQVKTYQEIAKAIGHPGAVRAVGSACGKNPWPFLIPCHRVVATHGLGGYGFGLALKRWLLQQEGYTTVYV